MNGYGPADTSRLIIWGDASADHKTLTFVPASPSRSATGVAPGFEMYDKASKWREIAGADDAGNLLVLNQAGETLTMSVDDFNCLAWRWTAPRIDKPQRERCARTSEAGVRCQRAKHTTRGGQTIGVCTWSWDLFDEPGRRHWLAIDQGRAMRMNQIACTGPDGRAYELIADVRARHEFEENDTVPVYMGDVLMDVDFDQFIVMGAGELDATGQARQVLGYWKELDGRGYSYHPKNLTSWPVTALTDVRWRRVDG